MLRAGTHKVPGRGREGAELGQVPRARVLKRRRAGADVNRWATQRGADGLGSPDRGIVACAHTRITLRRKSKEIWT